jgi:hypothetical protein
MSSVRIQRKCQQCATWNINNESHCKSCGWALEPEIRIKEEAQARARVRSSAPRGKLDNFIERFKNSRNPFLRVFYLVLSALWFVYWVILSFILWVIAASPG